MNHRVSEASTSDDYADLGTLVEAYLRSLPFELDFQDVDAELKALSCRYGPPSGAAFLARTSAGGAVGCVGLKSLGEDIGEVKRLYVVPEHRGHRLGRALLEALIHRAPSLGMQRVRLDTVTSLTEANALYERLGFVDIAPYNDNPQPDVRFMELVLAH